MLGPENVTKLVDLKMRLAQLKKEILLEKDNLTNAGNFETNPTNRKDNRSSSSNCPRKELTMIHDELNDIRNLLNGNIDYIKTIIIM